MKITISILTFSFLSLVGFSQSITLVKDFSNSTINYQGPHFDFNGRTYFPQSYGGYDLWSTDGTTIGTTPTLIGGGLNNILYHDSLYFTINNNLYKSGTMLDTTLVYSFNTPCPSTGSCYGGLFYDKIIYHDEIYFQGMDPVNGYELWKTNGTPSGTGLVRNINTKPHTCGTLSSEPSSFSILHDKMLFFCFAGGNASLFIPPHQLWESDGTFSGTDSVKNLYECSGPEKMQIGSSLFFIGGALSKTDGTFFGTVDSSSHSGITHFDEFNDSVLCVYAGTFSTDGRIELVDTSYPAPSAATLYNDANTNIIPIGKLSNNNYYFLAYNRTTLNDYSLYKTAGAGSTVLVKNFGHAGFPIITSPPYDAIIYHDSIWLKAPDATNASYAQLWVSDGSTAGTYELIPSFTANPTPNPGGFFIGNNMLFFSANYNGLDYSLYRIGSPDALSVATLKNNSNGNVFPSPNNGKFNISLDLNKGSNYKFVVYDNLGRIVHSQELQNKNTEITTKLNSGNYLWAIFERDIKTNCGMFSVIE